MNEYEQEWRHSSYPPWAHGPGYIISHDVAKFIVAGHRDRDLMVRMCVYIYIMVVVSN